MKLRKRWLIILTLVLALLPAFPTIPTPSVLAAEIMIDGFDSGTNLSLWLKADELTKSGSQVDQSAAILGGERDLHVTATANPSVFGPPRNAYQVASTNFYSDGLLKFGREVGVDTTTVELQWDGKDDDAATVDPTGLGDVDLTDDGTNDALVIDIAYNNLGVNILNVTAYSSATEFSTVVLAISSGNSGEGEYAIPFADFETLGGNDPDFTSLGALVLSFTSTSSGGGPHIDSIRAGKMDTTPPVTNADVTGTQLASGWYTEFPTVELTATDTDSGVADTFYSIDDGPETSYDGQFTVIGDGEHTVSFYSIDNKGNEETPKTIPIKIDRSGPTVTPNIDGIRFTGNEWYTSVASLKLEATDIGSGIDSFTYSINGDTPVSYTSGDLITSFGADGVYAVSYTVTDKAGHQTTNSIDFKIDGTAPTTSALMSGEIGSQDWYTSDVTVTLQTSDASSTSSGSGVSQTTYTLDGVEQDYTVPFTVSGDGEHTITFWSSDNTDNVETAKTQTIKIDTAAPGGSVEYDPPANANGWWNSLPIEYTVTCTDPTPGSGVVQATTTESIASADVTNVIVQCADNAGNTTPVSVDFQIDMLDPQVSFPQPYFFFEGGSLTLDASASSDTVITGFPSSGIDTIRWDLDNDGSYESPDKSVVTRQDNTSFWVSVQVTDKAGNVATVGRTITVLNAPPEVNDVLVDNQQITILATDPAGTNDTLSYQIDCDGDDVIDFGPQASNVFMCPIGAARQVGTVWVFDEDQGLTSANFELVNSIDLCANQWNGSLRVKTTECGRGEIELNLPSDESITICANEWNGAAHYSPNGDCGRSELAISYPDDSPIDICVNQWNGTLRIVDGPGQCNRSEYHRLI